MKKILLIEDDRDLNAGLSYDLEMEHYKVRAAFTLGEGIRLLAEEPADLILGRLTVKLRKNLYNPHQVCIFLSIFLF